MRQLTDNKTNWLVYEKIVNKEFTDIVISKPALSKLLRKEKVSIRLANYQIDYLKEKYPTGKFSEALRSALDDLIKKNGDEEKYESK